MSLRPPVKTSTMESPAEVNAGAFRELFSSIANESARAVESSAARRVESWGGRISSCSSLTSSCAEAEKAAAKNTDREIKIYFRYFKVNFLPKFASTKLI